MAQMVRQCIRISSAIHLFPSTREAIIDGLVGTVFSGAVLLAAPDLQNMHDPAQNTAIVLASRAGLVNRQVRNYFSQMRISEPKKVRVHGLAPSIAKPLNQRKVN